MSSSVSTASRQPVEGDPTLAPSPRDEPTEAYPAPLIILGSPRSFTSLICGMLGQHPEAYGMPELNLFLAGSVKEMIEQLTGYRQIQMHGLLRAVSQLYGGEQTMAGVDMARRWLLTRLDTSTAEVYQQLCRRVAPLRIIDKSPVYSLKPEYLARVHAALPNARYLHLLRHPRTQGESLMKVAKGLMAVLANSIDYDTDPPTLDPQLAWCQMQKNIIAFLDKLPPSRYMRLRGEDVLNSRPAHLRLICEWLGMSGDASAIDAMLHPEQSPFACLGPLGAHLGNDINFLRSPALRDSQIPASSLSGPLPWRSDGRTFNDETLELAKTLGYS